MTRPPGRGLQPDPARRPAPGVTDLRGRLRSGFGSPEGVVYAGIGSQYQDTDPAGSGTIYKKTTASGNTGWVDMSSGGGGGGITRNWVKADPWNGWETNGSLLVPRLDTPLTGEGTFNLVYPNATRGYAGLDVPETGAYLARLEFNWLLPTYTGENPAGTNPYWATFSPLDGLAAGYTNAATCFISGTGEDMPPIPAPFLVTQGWNTHWHGVFLVDNIADNGIAVGFTGPPNLWTKDWQPWTATFTSDPGGSGNLFVAKLG